MTVQSTASLSDAATPLSTSLAIVGDPEALSINRDGPVRNQTVVPVSVIVPFHNGHRTIQRVLDSIDAQSVRPAEVVLVDDGSRQPLREADLSCQVDLRILRHETNTGIPAARNAGVRHARNDWIAFLDHDDEWVPEKLARQWELLCSEPAPESVVFYGRCMWLEPAERKAVLFPGPEAVDDLRRGGKPVLSTVLRRGLSVPFITLLLHRGLFSRYGYLDERIRGGSDDYEFVLRLASQGVRFVTSDFEERRRFSAIYHMGVGNHSRNPGFLKEECAFLRQIAQDSPQLRPEVDRALARSFYRAGRIYERRKEKAAARESYRTSLRYNRRAPATWLALVGVPLGGRLRSVLERTWAFGRRVRETVALGAYETRRWLEKG